MDTSPSPPKSIVLLLLTGIFSVTAISAAEITFSYDDLGRLKTINYGGGNTLTYGYDKADNRTRLATVVKDRDSDGLSDHWELAYGLDPDNPADAHLDKDRDGLTNLEEYLAATHPNDGDSDDDDMPDDWELKYGLIPHRFDAYGDADKDGLDNLTEFLYGRHPTVNEGTIMAIINGVLLGQ